VCRGRRHVDVVKVAQSAKTQGHQHDPSSKSFQFDSDTSFTRCCIAYCGPIYEAIREA
jgi:hypothetical protein